MNESVLEYQRLEDSKNVPQPKYYQWYSDLKSLVDSNINRDDIVISELLKRLSAYGKVIFLSVSLIKSKNFTHRFKA